MRRLFAAALGPIVAMTALAGVVAFSSNDCVEREAAAKEGYDSPYSFEQTWSTSVRLLRVDLGLKVTEKDEKNGFLLFEYEDKGTTSPGSIELLRGDKGIRVVCQLPKFPAYHELAILDRLARKLRDEYGSPPEKKPDAGPPPPVDAGEDAPSD